MRSPGPLSPSLIVHGGLSSHARDVDSEAEAEAEAWRTLRGERVLSNPKVHREAGEPT